MIFTATARWDFRGETWFSVELEAVDLEVAGAMFYAMLPTTFFRGRKRLVSIRPQNLNSFDLKMLAHKSESQPEPKRDQKPAATLESISPDSASTHDRR